MSALGRMLTTIAVVGLVASAPITASAGEPTDVIDDKTAKEVKEKPDDRGWEAYVDFGASFQLGHSDGVIGKLDGVTLTLGATLGSGVSYIKGIHDWRTRLGINLAFTQTPVIDDLVKSTDKFIFDTAYYLRALDWIGPFARFTLDTALLPGTDVRATESLFQIAKQDGTTEDKTTSALHLSDSFQPLTLKQSIGAFIRPYIKPEAELEFRVGLGAQEIIADKQLLTSDNADTADVIEVNELRDSYAVGAEIAAQLLGVIEEGKVSYLLRAEVLIPFAADQAAGENRSAVDLTNADFNAKISFKLVSWASLDYEFRAQLQPQLSKDWQIQNLLLLTFGYGFKWSETDEQKKPEENK